MKYLLPLILLVAGIMPLKAEEEGMNPDRIVEIIIEIGDEVLVDRNIVQFRFAEVPMIMVYDNSADRMRIISPIAKLEELEEGELLRTMQANFASALDVRYAVSSGTMWSAFLHPISQLTSPMVVSAIQQVAAANLTFGTEYTSTGMTFGGGDAQPKPETIEIPEGEQS